METENILAMVKKVVENKTQWYAGETVIVFQTKSQRVYLTNSNGDVRLYVRKGKRTMKNVLRVASLMPNGWQLRRDIDLQYGIFVNNITKELSK